MGTLKTNLRSLTGRWMLLLILGFLFPACSAAPLKIMKTDQARGIYHRVKSGETLYQISRAYDVDLQELAEANNIEDANRLEAGGVIFVPDARQVIDDVMKSLEARRPAGDIPPAKAVPVRTVAPVDRLPKPPPDRDAAALPGSKTATSTLRIMPLQVLARMPGPHSEEGKDRPSGPAAKPPEGVVDQPRTSADQPDVAPGPARTQQDVASREPSEGNGRFADPPPRTADAKSVQFDRKRFIWPVKGKVVLRFGIQPNGMYNNGITIAAGPDTPVVAAAKGVVIFSGLMPGYGETIIVMHDDHYATVYTNLGQRNAKVDDRTKQGVLIGYLGKGAEKAGAPRLNFEIRHHNKARNPLFFLP